MKGKELNAKETKSKKIVVIFIYAIFIIALVYSGFKIFSWYRDNKQTNKLMEQLKETVTVETDEDKETEYKIDFVTLLKRIAIIVVYLLDILFLKMQIK